MSKNIDFSVMGGLTLNSPILGARAVIESSVAVYEPAISKFLATLASKKPNDSPITREVFEWASRLDQSNAEAMRGQGVCALAMKDWGRAQGRLLDAAKLFEDQKQRDDTMLAASVAADNAGAWHWAIHIALEVLNSDPSNTNARVQLYGLLEQYGLTEAMSQTISEGLALNPDHPDLTFARAEMALKRGDYDAAWPDFESRPTHLTLVKHMDEYPEWQGEPPAGKTILVMREAGLGDEIMFSRYFQPLRALGAHVVLFTNPLLARLFYELADEIITSEFDIPDFDYWVASGSLALRLSPQGVLLHVVATPAANEPKPALIPNTGRLRVGLRWGGNPKQPRERFRRVGFEELRPLLGLDADFYSLQDGADGNEASDGVVRLSDYQHDVADLATHITNLDVVITCDTMVAHLAASLGKPTWVLVSQPGAWHWGDKATSDWYPSVSIFRQETLGDWSGPIAVVKDRLERELEKPGVTITHPAMRAIQTELRENSLIVSRPCKYGQMSWYANDKYIGRSLDLYGEYSESEADILRAVLKPGDVVAEVGANIGALTAALADIVGSYGEVHAFEPQTEYFWLLGQNVDHTTVVDYCSAVGESDGTIKIAGVVTDKAFAPSWEVGQKSVAVLQATIDSLAFDRLNLIKIDIDGGELRALQGAEQTIARCRPILYLEYDKPHLYPDMLPWLDAHGYRIYQTKPRLYNPNNWRGNKVNVFGNIASFMLLCIPRERHDLRTDTLGIKGLDRVKIKTA